MSNYFKRFFKNPLGEILLWFVHNNSSLFYLTILNVEGTKMCATKTALKYFKLTNTNTLKHKAEEIFLPSKVREFLSKFQNANNILNNYHE